MPILRLTALRFASLAFALVTGVAVAHEPHCHVKNADGSFTDATSWTTKKDCQSHGGVWKHHHGRCRGAVKGAAKTHALSESECVAAGGTWKDDGHAAQHAR